MAISPDGLYPHETRKSQKFQPKTTHGDRVFLLLDTEGSGRAPELPDAERHAGKYGIEIVYSCPAFEYWLLCHFDRVPPGYCRDCAAVITKLNKQWNTVCQTSYDKSDKDIFDRLSQKFDVARLQALNIDCHHLSTTGVARRTNPSTQVYELIGILIGARTAEKCPITGTWKLINDAKVEIQLNKGEDMPNHEGRPVNWQL